AYDGGSGVLHDVSFDVAPGTCVGIIGATGAGKTTLVSLLTRFYDPTEGQILLDGVDVRDYRLADLRDQFAIVLQDPVLFSTSIGENIAYGRPGAGEGEVVAAAKAAGAHDFIVRSRLGYESRVGERGMQLSGGERQRIEVLRRGKKSSTYRLVEPTPSGASMIAQRACMAKAGIERTIYEEILPHLPVTSPRYYGFRAEDPDFAWLFLEDIGDERYTATDRAQLVLAGRWVGLMHTAAARVPAARGLPDGGPPRYLDHLRAGLQTIRANLANPALRADDAATLGRLASDLERLETAWAALECACTGLPATLVHGDLQRKNLYV